MEQYKKTIRDNIQSLIDTGNLTEASELISQYQSIVLNDVEVYSMQAVVAILEERFNDANNVLQQALNIDKNNFDLLYNLAYLYELQEQNQKALDIYSRLSGLSDSGVQRELVLDAIRRLQKSEMNDFEKVVPKKKVAFFVKQGMDSFLGNVINGLSEEYETKKVIVTQSSQIDLEMQWADVCWFEWCDDLIVYASHLEISRDKKIVCRLHSYEAFTDLPSRVQWDNVDHLICDVAHIKEIVLRKISIDVSKISLIPVSVDTEKFTFNNRRDGFNVAYVGYINYKKGPMLLIQFINALVKKDRRYKLYICGGFQDERDLLYFQQMIKEMGLEENLIHTGWIEDVNGWLEDKDYIISTSLLEGQHLSVMEGMCKGIKPIIHNFVGAKQVYREKYVWNTIDEAIKMVRESHYSSNEYREFILDNYSNESQILKVGQLFDNLIFEEKHKKNISVKEKPLVTVGIINYNYSKFLDQSVQSVLDQTYSNVELIIIDDCSKDDSIEKIKQYERQHKNVRGIYHKKNSGSAVLGFQETIREAKGKYLMILSADDFLDTEKVIYDFVDELLSNPSLDYVYGNLKIVDIDGKYRDVWRYKQYSDNEIIHDTFQRGGSAVLAITVGVYKTDFYRNNNLNWYDDKENRVAGDGLNSLIYLKHNFKYKYIDHESICYRHHNENMTYDLKDRIKSVISVVDYIINNFSEEIYLSEIDWNKCEGIRDRQATKMYHNGLHYMKMLKYYNNNMFKPWDGSSLQFSDNEIKSYISPLGLKVKEYLSKSMSYDDKYCLEIKNIYEELKQILN